MEKMNCPYCDHKFTLGMTWSEYFEHMHSCMKAFFKQSNNVTINGNPTIHPSVMIGEYSTIQDKGGIVNIGANCEIGERVSINCSDSHLRCIGLSEENEYLSIFIENNVYIGAGSIILGGTHIAHHSVIGAGVVLPKHTYIPPYSLIVGSFPDCPKYHWGEEAWIGNRAGRFPKIKPGYYREKLSNKD